MSGIINSTGSKSGVIGQTEEKVGMVHLASLTAASYGSLAFEGYFSSEYDHYIWYFWVRGATNNTDAAFRVRADNADRTDGSYRSMGTGGYMGTNSAISWNTNGAWGGSYGIIGSGDSSNLSRFSCTGQLQLANPLSTSVHKLWVGNSISWNSANEPTAMRNYTFTGMYYRTAALSGASFLFIGGNIDGKVSMYGVKNS